MLICLTVSAMQLLKTRWCTEPSNVAATGIIYSFSQTEVLVFVLGVWWHADTLHETLSLTLNCWQKETRLLARFHWKTSAKNQVRHPRIQPFKTSAYWLTLLRMDRCAYFQDFRNLRGKSYDLTFFFKNKFLLSKNINIMGATCFSGGSRGSALLSGTFSMAWDIFYQWPYTSGKFIF